MRPSFKILVLFTDRMVTNCPMQLRWDYIMAESICQGAKFRLPFVKTYAILFVSKEREVPPMAEQTKRPAVDRNSPEYQENLIRTGRTALIGVVILT